MCLFGIEIKAETVVIDAGIKWYVNKTPNVLEPGHRNIFSFYFGGRVALFRCEDSSTIIYFFPLFGLFAIIVSG